MQVRYYSVFDCVADEFGPLFPHRNDNSAFRAYSFGLTDKDPNEYQLWYIGELNDSMIECPDHSKRLIVEPHQVFADREEE